ncbi:cardiolipin synthase ClsB [Allopusillimonas soli]|uniref:Cardiolipin synthase B n=1 Tax=Allopusillimonas soli TaxID=659016 RepID=A0A853FBJ2_9BURK|nr:cardiolipin synthase ClsB [Allopusillimonas soli]NYT37327.1 cardiolipin synthase ClsB [Allopusillimonas soli]TEA74687.1 cardiolipin synthase ClsB [Allopusillimonas soli]
MAPRHTHIDWTQGNRIDLLHNGGEFFPALCEAIDQARSLVHLETYIFADDNTAKRVLDTLESACRRGVKVRVVIDGFGSNETVDAVTRRLSAMGAQYRVYRPEPRGVANVRFNVRRLRRLHRKTAVMDNAVAFVGGINILDDYEDVPNDGRGARPRFDFAVRIKGPLVDAVARAQRGLWLRMAWRRRDDWARFYERLRDWSAWRQRRVRHKQPVFDDGVRAALLVRDNLRHRQTIENVYLATLAGARDEILIANAYFLPGRRLRKALAEAAERGVRVRLLLQGHSEYAVQYRACRYMYGRMLEMGIEIHEYMASYLHAKVAAIDGCAMVGSSNLDPFSLLLAREANVYVQDHGFAHALAAVLESELRENARPVTAEALQRRHWITRQIDGFSYLMLRLGVALTGRSSEY